MFPNNKLVLRNTVLRDLLEGGVACVLVRRIGKGIAGGVVFLDVESDAVMWVEAILGIYPGRGKRIRTQSIMSPAFIDLAPWVSNAILKSCAYQTVDKFQ